MNLLLIGDAFPPSRSSAAIQLRDLSRQLAVDGHKLTVMIADEKQSLDVKSSFEEGYQIIRIKTPKTKDVAYFRRTLNEFLTPFVMLYRFSIMKRRRERFDGIIWYSPSIFFGPLVHFYKKINRCDAYLILRDIFPDWAADLGLIKRGIPYTILKLVASYQYFVADIIGVQSRGNLAYFAHTLKHGQGKIEVLQNWLGDQGKIECPIVLSDQFSKSCKYVVYAGNMGVAQDLNIFLQLAKNKSHVSDLVFVFVGRGQCKNLLQQTAIEMNLHNIMFFDEIEPDAIPKLYAQCDVGIISLAHEHKTHNIPGKLLSYLQCGMPCLAKVNPGNDLIDLIETWDVGRSCTSNSVDELEQKLNEVLHMIENDPDVQQRCASAFETHFSVKSASGQIVSALSDSMCSSPLNKDV